MPEVSLATNLRNESFVTATSRYMKSKLVYWGNLKIVTFETYKRKKFVSSQGDRFYVITKGTEYRPDTVSWNVYGDVDFWWVLLEANNMKDIWDFKAGTNIIIPGNI